MHTTNPHLTITQSPPGVIPRLEAGDKLTRAEFERRYTAMPNLKKAELIEGVVYVPSPIANPHSKADSRLQLVLLTYFAATPGVEVGHNETVRLDLDNEPQPDSLLRIKEECGGQCEVGEGSFLVRAPELVVEIATSSVSYDLHAKLQVYRRNGVQEYVVWRVLEEDLDWFVLREGAYEKLIPDEAGVFASQVFPGLWLDKAALFRDDTATVLAVLQRGLDSREHAEFVERLKAAAANAAK